MKQESEQEQRTRQKKAWENRECIQPGDVLTMRCSFADERLARFGLPSGDLVCSQEPGRTLKKGGCVRLKCTAATTGRNGYGPFVDYSFCIEETGHIVLINGPDAQSLAEKKSAPITVRNRDIPALSEVLGVMQTISKLEARREWQRERLYHITQKLTGMPGGGGNPKGLDDAVSMLDEIDREHGRECVEYVHQLRRAQRILNGIESPSMRTFVLMKYIMGCGAKEIRQELNMTEWGYRRACRCVEDAENMGTVKWQERFILVS